MLDLFYLGGAMLFFALMLLYVRAVEKLGKPADASQASLQDRGL